MDINEDMNKPLDENTEVQNNNAESAQQATQDEMPATPQPVATSGNSAAVCEPKSKCNLTVINTIMLAILLVGLVVLYILHFTGAGTPSKHNPNAAKPVVAKDGVLKIAYVDSDTLLAKYQYAIDLQEQLNQYKTAQEKSYQQQMTKFQSDYQNYLKTGENMTLSQQQAKEAELKQRADKLAGLQEELSAKVLKKQMDSNIELLNRIFAFVREYNAANQQFDIILRKTFNDSPSLYMNPGMDITDEILQGLNDEYKKVKGKKK